MTSITFAENYFTCFRFSNNFSCHSRVPTIQVHPPAFRTRCPCNPMPSKPRGETDAASPAGSLDYRVHLVEELRISLPRVTSNLEPTMFSGGIFGSWVLGGKDGSCLRSRRIKRGPLRLSCFSQFQEWSFLQRHKVIFSTKFDFAKNVVLASIHLLIPFKNTLIYSIFKLNLFSLSIVF